MKIKAITKRVLNDKIYRVYVSALCSFFATLAFAIYNSYLGIRYKIIFSSAISIYYLLLILIRGTILLSEKGKNRELRRKLIYKISSLFLFIINIALIFPITLMVMDKKEVNISLIPSIAMAVYTTYKISIGIYNYKKYRVNTNILIRQLKLINLIDAIVSILTLQNTLILVNGGMNEDMRILSSFTSFGFVIIIIFISIQSYLKNRIS